MYLGMICHMIHWKKATGEFEYQLTHLTMKEKIVHKIMVVIGECEDGCLIGDYDVCREV